MKSISAKLKGSLASKPTRSNTPRVFRRVGFFHFSPAEECTQPGEVNSIPVGSDDRMRPTPSLRRPRGRMFQTRSFMMMCLKNWLSATVAIALLAGTVAAADTVAGGKVKSVNADNKTFVL